MNAPSHPASYSDQLEYLKLVIESAERRRDAVENKASILIASNAILLTALATLVPSLVTAKGNPTGWIPVGLGALTLVSVVVSTMSAIGILVSISSGERRLQVLDITEPELNIFFFDKVAEKTKADYLAVIRGLTDQMILEQLAAEAHNVSRLTRERYRYLYFSHRAFLVSVVLFLSVLMSKIIFL